VDVEGDVLEGPDFFASATLFMPAAAKAVPEAADAMCEDVPECVVRDGGAQTVALAEIPNADDGGRHILA